MSVSILEALQNAEYNLCNPNHPMQTEIGKTQLKNAVGLLNKGYSIDDEVEPLLEKYDGLENVPYKED